MGQIDEIIKELAKDYRETCQWCSKYPASIYTCEYHQGYEDGMDILADRIEQWNRPLT